MGASISMLPSARCGMCTPPRTSVAARLSRSGSLRRRIVVVGVDGTLQVDPRRLVGVELRRAHHLGLVLVHHYPLFFAHLAAELLYRDQEVVLLAHPEEAVAAHVQEARKAYYSVDVEVLHGPYLLALDVEPADILPGLFKVQARTALLMRLGSACSTSTSLPHKSTSIYSLDALHT